MSRDEFDAERDHRIRQYATDGALRYASRAFLAQSIRAKYSYNFDWLGRPVIQYPQDLVALQELIWCVRPDLIIETGIARGGSLILSASMLALLDYCDAVASGTSFDPLASSRRVVGVDIEIRDHNRIAVEAHPLAHKITMIEGSSIAADTIASVALLASASLRTLVLLDSNHTHEHVLAELRAYAPLVSIGSYCVVFDTVIDELPPASFSDRPWCPGNSPMSAVSQYLRELAADHIVAPSGEHLMFEVDSVIDSKLQITVALGGYLRRLN